ncbi:DUF6233 domain-containing protein [Streptomyces sp. NPDC057199]
MQAITQQEAKRALYEHGPTCSHCNPDTELGALSG